MQFRESFVYKYKIVYLLWMMDNNHPGIQNKAHNNIHATLDDIDK